MWHEASTTFFNSNLFKASLHVNPAGLSEFFHMFYSKFLSCRYTLVLHIFREYAHTREAKLQIALAEIPYIR